MVVLELRHRLRPSSPLELLPGAFQVRRRAQGLEVTGEIRIRNSHPRMEVMVPEITLLPTVLGRSDVSQVRHELRITPLHPDEEARPDGYWAAYIVKGRKTTAAHICLNLIGPAGLDLETVLDTLWMDIHWVNYGPFGRLQRRQGILLPLQKPEPGDPSAPGWRDGERCRVLPVRTHLLGVLDDPLEVLQRYTAGLRVEF